MIRLLKLDVLDELLILESFGEDISPPPYAILSHTWGEDGDEVTFQDLENKTYKNKPGYDKIRFCGEQAIKDGLEYFWVDTCCINKSSSAELQEAITTMFSWYCNASRCYVNLADVSAIEGKFEDEGTQDPWKSNFRSSRWFTRGWTLQELLAPNSVEFFSVQGTRIGDKKSLEGLIHEITGIPHHALRGAEITTFSTAERLSWAENRQTKRREDKAYSLLGIFSIFMPLMYGEGDNAFARLQDEISKKHVHGARLTEVLLKIPMIPQAAFNSLENQHGSTCLPETRVELLRDITAWVDGTDKRCIFWLNGIAGTGKSTVARTIARRYYDRGQLGASFFFSRGAGDVSRADKLVTTFAWQLAHRIPLVREHICEAINDQEDIATYSLRDQWDQLILKPLSRLSSSTSTITIVLVLDALDECESERDIRIILRLLAMTKLLNNIRLRIFITSRPETSIRCGFSQISEAERQVFVLHDILPAIVDRDIGVFFQHNFATIREERGFSSDWPGIRVIKRLVEISGGLFIWASTACRFIRDGRRLAMRRISALINGRNSGSGPQRQLDEIYATVLRSSISQDFNEKEKREVHLILRDVLGSIVLLFSPLSMDSLSHLLPLSSSDISETMADLHPIFNVPSQSDGPILLHHPTFRDFILDKDRCSDLNFLVDEKQTHKAMADNCIQLMSKMLKRDICNLQSPGILAKNIDPKLIRQRIPPELEYACRYWVQHYRESKTRLHDDDQAHFFFKEYFLYWVEVMSLVGKISEVAAILRIYAALLQPGENFRQLTFVQDARRLFTSFLSIIEHAPLQTYCSALVFSQPSNELRCHFWSQMRRWIQDVQIAEVISAKAKKLKTSKTFFVNELSFSPDGQQLASGSIDEVVRVWNVATKTKLTAFEGQADKVSAVAISADGVMIASGSDDGTVMVWELSTGTVRHTLRKHSGWINSVVFSPDSKLLASGSMDETVRIWDAKKGKELCILECKSSCISSVAFSPDGSKIASGSADQMVRLWDLEQQEISMLLDGHSGAINSIEFSPDGKWIVSGADDMTAKLWDMTTGTERSTLKGHQRRVMAVAFSPDAHLIASGSEDMTVILWSAFTGSLLGTLRGHTSGINAVIFSPDSQLLVTSSSDEEVRLWDAKSGDSRGEFDEFGDDDKPSMREKLKTLRLEESVATAEALKGHSSPIVSIVFSPDGHLVASGSQDTTIKLWNREGVQRWRLEAHSDSISCLAFSPNAHLLASASADKTAILWSTETGAALHTLRGHLDNVRLVRFSLDGQVLASCSTDKTAILWDVKNGTMMNRLDGHSDTVNDVKFSPVDNCVLATCSADTTIRLWDVSTGVVSRIFRGHSDTVNSVAFSSDSKLLISCSADTTIRIWDTAGVPYGTLKGHTLPVNSVVFSPDNKLVVSCSDDQTVRVWDLESRLAREIFQSAVVVRTLDFSSSGRYIETDRGVLDVCLMSSTSPSISMDGEFTLFATKDWLRRGAECVLWLPDECHATSVTAQSDTVVLGHASGSVTFVHF